MNRKLLTAVLLLWGCSTKPDPQRYGDPIPPAGLHVVAHDTSITGTGTVASPLGVNVACGSGVISAIVGGNPACVAAGGVTNSAGANVVTKSDGTNLIASSISDNGTTVATTELVQAASLQVTSSGPTITEGSSPPSGSCSPNGSVYLNTNGGSVFGCVGAAWLPALADVIAATMPSTTTNDYNPTNLAVASTLALTSAGATSTLTGLLAPSAAGRRVTIVNVDPTYNIIVSSNSSSSSAANRITGPWGTVGITLPGGANASVTLEYESSSRWRIIAYSLNDYPSIISDSTYTVGGSSGPTWASGSSAPSGACTGGSMYSQTGSTDAFYICAGTGPAWAAVASGGGAISGLTSGQMVVASGTNTVANGAESDFSGYFGVPGVWYVNASTGNGIFAGNLTASGGFSSGGYVLGYGNTVALGITDDLFFGFNTNAATTGYINDVGYSAGTTQYRDLEIDDGKGSGASSGHQVAYFTGSTHSEHVYGALTVDAGISATSSGSSFNSIGVSLSTPGLTTSQIALGAANTATFNTTSGAMTSYGLNSSVTSTRSAGTNSLTNENYFTASGAQNNYAIYADAGDVKLNQTSGSTTFGGPVLVSGTTPTISSCGTSPSVVGGYSAFKITFGTGSPASCTATWGAAWTHAPICTSTLAISAVSTTAITLTTAGFTAGNVICVGY